MSRQLGREQPALKLPAGHHTGWPSPSRRRRSLQERPASIKQSRNCRAYSSFRPTGRLPPTAGPGLDHARRPAEIIKDACDGRCRLTGGTAHKRRTDCDHEPCRPDCHVPPHSPPCYRFHFSSSTVHRVLIDVNLLWNFVHNYSILSYRVYFHTMNIVWGKVSK